MAQVFLSYARDDVGKARSLAAAIEKAGYSVWWDRELVGGAEYSREIDDALKAAEVVIVLWSKVSVGSAWVRDEAAAGRDTGRLVPAQLDNSEPPLGFRQYQTIDLSRWNGRSDSAGVKTLKRAIAAKVGRDPAATQPEPAVERRRMAVPRWALPLAVVLVLVAAVGGYFWFARQASAGAPSVAIVAAPNAADRAGSEAMARRLAIRIGELRSPTSDAVTLRDAATSPDQLDYSIRVSSTRQGANPSVELALSSNADSKILWTYNLQGEGSADQVEQQASYRLALMLKCLGEAKPASGTQLDDQTMQFWLRGCERFDEPVGNRVESELISQFRQVTERAPRFAPAWAHLAALELASETVGQAARDPSIQRRAREYLERARKLDPNLGMVYLLEAGWLRYDQWEKRIELLQRGLERQPDNAGLHEALSIDLRQVGRMDDAVASALRAAQLNPLSPRTQAAPIPILSAADRLEEARARLEMVERIWPGAPVVRDARYAFDLRYGDPARALAMLQREPGRAGSIAASTLVPNPAVELFLKARIDPTQANKDAAVAAYLARYRKDPTSADITSLVALGRVDLAYQVLQNPATVKAVSQFIGVVFRAPMRPFRNDPRFMPLMARLGLIRYWQETNTWPDFCLETDLPYDCKAEAAKLKAAGRVA